MPGRNRKRTKRPRLSEDGRRDVLTVGGAGGCQSQEVLGLLSGPAPVAPAAPAAGVQPSGASSSCSRLSCRGELPRDWNRGGDARPVGPAADRGVAGVATRDAGGPRSARGQAQGRVGGEVRPGSWGCEAGVWDAKFGWPGKKAWGRLGVTGAKG